MAKVVKVYVVDDHGNGLAGQKVKTYGGALMKTDREGCASLIIDRSEVSIFINGHEAFDGYSMRLGSVEVFTKAGRRP
jgi:hypothetical protein